jgi:hypothetical protein
VVDGPDCATAAPAGDAGTADQRITAVAATASTDQQPPARTPDAPRAPATHDRLIPMHSPDDTRWSPEL